MSCTLASSSACGPSRQDWVTLTELAVWFAVAAAPEALPVAKRQKKTKRGAEAPPPVAAVSPTQSDSAVEEWQEAGSALMRHASDDTIQLRTWGQRGQRNDRGSMGGRGKALERCAIPACRPKLRTPAAVSLMRPE